MHLAPEMLHSRRPSVPGDIYAMGVTLYRLVNGDSFLPTMPDLLDLRDAIREGRYPDREKFRLYVPRALRRVVNQALDPDPGNRFQSAADFRHALEKVPIYADFHETYASNKTAWTGSAKDRVWRIELEELRNGGARVRTSSTANGRTHSHPKLSARVSSVGGAEKRVAKLLQAIVQGTAMKSLPVVAVAKRDVD
jgi:serine/threonine-protein kinase